MPPPEFEIEFEPVVTEVAVKKVLASGDPKRIAELWNLLHHGQSSTENGKERQFRYDILNHLGMAPKNSQGKKHRGKFRSLNHGSALVKFLGLSFQAKGRHR